MSKLVCSRCGSDEVEVRMWVNPNTKEIGADCDCGEAWCNNCLSECTLEQKDDNPDLKGKFVVIMWPEIQHFMIEGFEENAELINDEKGLDDFGSSAYFVNVQWALPVLGDVPSAESLYVYVDFPKSQTFEDLDEFEANAYPALESGGWFVSCEWLEKKRNEHVNN